MNIDKKELNIAKNYAKALLTITEEQSSSEQIYNQFKDIIQILYNSEDLKEFLSNPLISASDKKEIIYKVFGKDFDLQLINLLNTLADNKRLYLAETVLYSYGQLYENTNNISNVTVISAVDIPEENKKKLIDILKRKLCGEVIPDYQINDDIIGGLIIKIKDKVIDLSLKSKITEMEKQLI